MTNYNAEQLHRSQLLQSVIDTYGMMYLDQISEEEFEDLIEEANKFE